MTLSEILRIKSSCHPADIEIQHTPSKNYTVLTGVTRRGSAFYHPLTKRNFDNLLRKNLIGNRTKKKHELIQIYEFI